MLFIKNARISTGVANETRKVDVTVDGERFVSINDAGSHPHPDGAEVIDANGLLMLPGAFDPHVHFNTPGFESREDFAHGSRAAAAGGVTTVIDMPDTSLPPVTDVANLHTKLAAISPQAYVDFALWGGVSGNAVRELGWLDNIEDLYREGVVGFKAYLISGMDTFRELSFMELGQVMAKANELGALVGLHAEDGRQIRERTKKLQAAGKKSLEDYYASRAEPAESDGVTIGVALAKSTHAKLHVVHLASGSGSNLIALAKQSGIDVSCETCPHYLAFTRDDFARLGAYLKTAPVVKTAADRDALWSALENGDIDFLATDHAPAPPEQKNTGNAWTDYGGIPGVELMLPFAFSEGYKKGRFSLARLIEITSSAAAKRFGFFPKKGAISTYSDADFVLIDPDAETLIEGAKLHSKAKWSVFEGMKFKGKIIATYLRGKKIFDANLDVVGRAGDGKWLRRG